MATKHMADITQNGATAEPTSPDISTEERELWDWLDNLATESERIRRQEARFDDYDEFLDMFRGKHWPSVIPTFRPPIVVNELRSLILSEASDLTESQLRIYVTKDPRAGGRDEQVERALRAVWQRQQVDLKLVDACVWALICGTGFIEVAWDPDAYHGLGDVLITAPDPRTILPDPDARDDRTWLYRIREEVLDVHEIRRLWPVAGMRVKPDDAYSVRDSRARAGTNPAYVGPMTPGTSFVHGTEAGYKKARARVLDCFLHDGTIEESAEEDGTDEQGQPKFKVSVQAKYPNGRRVVGANGVILYDGPVPPSYQNDFGLLRVVLEPTPDSFWGIGFVQQTAELQLAADKLASNIVENAVRLNNGIVVSTTNTGLDWETFAGIPAQIVQINPGSEFKIQYPPAMPPDMVKAPWTMLDMQRRILGFQDARSGMASKGNVSAELTETEISQAQSVSRLRARLLHATVQRLAEMILTRMAFGYTTPRAIPAVDGEQFKPVTWQPLEDPEKFAVHVDKDSFTVMSRTMLRRLSLMLRKLNVIDRKAVLESVGFPNADAIAQRMDQAEKMAAMAKMQSKKGGK